MHLIEQITNDLVNDGLSVASALTKTKVLASRIGQQELLAWANNELKGYDNPEHLPDYRKFRGSITVDYIDGFNQVTGFPLTLDFDEETLLAFETARFGQGVQQLEQLVTDHPKGIRYEFNTKQRHILHQMFQRVNGSYYQLTSAGISLPPTVITGVLSAIRQRLLDFMLELESRFGLLADLSILKANAPIIHQYMETTIHNTGDGNVINTGDHAQVNADITISKGDKTQLRDKLLAQQVSTEDANELLAFIDSEPPESASRFGAKVNTWIAKMIAKSLDGSWEIGISAAGGVLATAIAKYYGLG